MCAPFVESCCQYKSIRYIRVRNKRLASIYYGLIAIVLIYVVIYTIIIDKGYQDFDDVTGTTSAKVKGSACTGNLNNYTNIEELLPLDSMDLKQPSNEEDAFFITTARTITINQTRRFCDGNSKVPECTHNDVSACTENLFSAKSQGLFTGKCGSNGRCQMYSWCPLEDPSNFEIIHNIGALTVFIKVDISFDRFGVSRGNTYDIDGTGDLVDGYNLFTIEEIVSNATNGILTTTEVAETGAIILISSIWNCDLDRGESRCNPKFQMKRIDDSPGIDTVSFGYNFRTVDYNPTQEFRVLKKLYGIRVVFIVEGQAARFDWVALSVTLGSGLAYLGIAAVITDLILENFLKESKTYVANKERLVKGHVGQSSIAGNVNIQEMSTTQFGSELAPYSVLDDENDDILVTSHRAMAFLSEKSDKADRFTNLWKSFMKGTMTGATEALICYPTEFIKTQLQLQSRTNPEFKGIGDCAIKIVKRHGPLGLYRGLLPLLIGSSGKQAARWTAYTNTSALFRDEDGNIGLAANMFSGFMAGTSEAILAVTPIETIKTRVVDDLRGGTKKYKGSFDAVYKIVSSEGIAGIYRGVAPTIAKQGTNQMVRFPIQTFIVRTICGDDHEMKKSPVLNGLAGAGAGACSVLLTMPQDTIKTRMQGEEAKKLYSGMMDCARKIYQKEGLTFFYVGTWPRLVRVSLDVGITFFIYPLLHRLF